MSLPRVVMVSRRFWPLVGGAETVMAGLAASFHARGAATTLLTARWRPEWPLTIEHRGVRVVRIAQPAQRFWGSARYMMRLSAWLQSHAGQFDVVYVSMLKHDAFAALGACRSLGVPVVLRVEGGGPSGDCYWQTHHSLGSAMRRRCRRRAAAIVAPSTAIEQELLLTGYPPELITPIPNGVPIPEPRSAERQVRARVSLALANPALRFGPRDRLTVYTGRLHPLKGLDTLIAAWRLVARDHPQEKLWIVGEGPEEQRLAEQIAAAGLEEQVALAGAFDSVDDLLLAADRFVLPSHEEGMSLALLEAMAAGLPVVASDIAGNRAILEHNVQGMLAPPGDADTLAAALLSLVRDPLRGERLGAAARRRVSEHFSLDRMTDRHLALFERVAKRAAR